MKLTKAWLILTMGCLVAAIAAQHQEEKDDVVYVKTARNNDDAAGNSDGAANTKIYTPYISEYDTLRVERYYNPLQFETAMRATGITDAEYTACATPIRHGSTTSSTTTSSSTRWRPRRKTPAGPRTACGSRRPR